MLPIKKLLLIPCLLFGLTFTGYAQTTVSGTVTDAETGDPLPGVNITLTSDNSQGTSTNADGEYTLSVPSDDETLRFTYVGYEQQEVDIDGESTIDIEMSQDVTTLEDVVVIGYGEQETGDNTGSIKSVSSSDFNQGAVSSAGELFQGKTAGVNVTSADGAPGSGPTIRIRGGSSLSASNDPLYVIDGVPLDEGGVSGMRNPLNTINPNDIESINILKDASATAIYGSRASNGVVIINTKRGKEGESLSVDYNTKLSYQTNRKRVEMFGTDEFRDVIDEQFGESGTEKLGDANTDWQDQIYRNAFSQDHNLSFTGAYKSIPYRASLGFTGDQGILKTDQNNRLTGSIAINPTFLDDNLQVSANLKGMQVKNQFGNQDAIGNAVIFDPTQPVTLDDEDAPYGGYYTWTDGSGNPITIAPDNPVALIEQTDDRSTVYRSIGNLELDYTMPFLPELSATLNAGYDYSDVANGERTIPEDAAFEDDGSDTPGLREDYDQRKENELIDFYLNYDSELEPLNSELDLTAGYSWEHHFEEGFNYVTNFDRDEDVVVDEDTDFATENYIVSFFSRLNYTFNDKYLLTATLRRDGTSRFSEENRWGLFPSAALAWQIHEESFLQNVDVLDQLKLRLGYGITGQQSIGEGDYPYLPQYTYGEDNARYQFGNDFVTTLRPEGYNSELKWEETTTYNIALDYAFLDERLSGTIEAYQRETNDLLNVIPVSAGSNFTNRILSNVGSLDVQGIEFDITGRPIVTNDTYWEVGFNATHNRDEISRLTAVEDPDFEGVEVGGIAGGTGNTIQIHSEGYPRNAFFVYEQVYDEDGDPIEGLYVDQNGDGEINADDLYRHESPTPDFTFGLSSRFEHKNWDASFSTRANLGNHVYNNVNSSNAFYSEMDYGSYLRNAPTSVRETEFENAQFLSDHYVENASFLRLDNVTLGYTFDNVWDTISSFRVSTTVQNAFVLTNYSGLDPEVSSGIDNNIYPRPRTFVLSLNLDF